MTNHYRSGAVFERRISAILEAQGYYVIRAAGSHGIADIVAIKPGEIVFAQCKAGQTKIPLPEWNRLYVLATAVGAVPVLVTRDRLGRVGWAELLGTAEPRHPRLSRIWLPDRVGSDAP